MICARARVTHEILFNARVQMSAAVAVTNDEAAARAAIELKQHIVETARRLDAIERERRAHDYLYDVFTNQDPTTRREMVNGIRALVETRYAEEMSRASGCNYAAVNARFFDVCARRGAVPNMLQCALVLHCVLHETSVNSFLAPPLAIVDADGIVAEVGGGAAAAAHDSACVDRHALRSFETLHLKAIFDDLNNGESYNFATAVVECVVRYRALLPADPFARPGRAPLDKRIKANMHREHSRAGGAAAAAHKR